MSGSVRILAEAAQGFEGDATLARMLVRAAAAGAADLVKFQLVYAGELATPTYRYHDLFRQLEMSDAAWAGVCAEADKAGIGFVFDVFGPRSLDLAIRLKAAAVKIHATDFFNDTLIEAALRGTPEVFLSAGGITIEELKVFVDRHRRGGGEKLVLLYGYQAEPTALRDTNLARLGAIHAMFPDLRIGFLDHADGRADEAHWLGLLALPFGATVIEKHLTLDRSLELEDSISALAAADFRRYAERVRAAATAVGRGDLTLSADELAYRSRALKAVVAVRPIPAAATVAGEDVALLRTAIKDGAEPLRRLSDVVGRRARHEIERFAAVGAEDLA